HPDLWSRTPGSRVLKEWVQQARLSSQAAESTPPPPPTDELTQAAQAYQDFRRSHLGKAVDHLEPCRDGLPEESTYARFFKELFQADPQAADHLAQAVNALPAPGTDFLDFHLIAELGQGAFGKVYLARQGDLANRLVALKVSSELFAESQTLAQLQHTH